jgi:serine/threonine protein kinase/Tol biopolymer transport system component
MGEVYRARDLKLKRVVAIKILREEFSRDADRVNRFQREAEVLASLNHPNIAAIHDLQETNGTRYLVLELVEGETLADRIARGPIPVEEALTISQQICEALEAAHERGVIHRDLKPANVKLTTEGKVKVLDFGLAKAVERTPQSPTLSNSPTMLSGTMGGVIIGTAAYMSPEQARGGPVDKRSDIWAFGVVLYEMLSGRPLFEGQTISDTLAAVLIKEPDLEQISARVKPLLRRCLEKDLKRRLRDIGEARFLLENTPATAPSKRRLEWVPQMGWVAAVAIALGSLLLWAPWRTPLQPELVRFQIPTPENSGFGAMPPVISPDGRKLAFIASGNSNTPELWVRFLDTLEARPLAGSENAIAPFWSPDSRSIGFETSGTIKLKRVEISGGPPQTLCDANAGPGTWSKDGVIVFRNSTTGLMRVPAGGGDCTQLTKFDPVRGDTNHRYPYFLPYGRHFLYQRVSNRPENTGIYIGSLDSKPEQQSTKRLMPAESNVVYAYDGKSGYLLFLRERTLFAQPFDAGKLELAGEALPVAEQVGSGSNNIGGFFSASLNGILSYRVGPAGGEGNFQLALFNRQGKLVRVLDERGLYFEPAFSPDGTQVAFRRLDNAGSAPDIWVHEFAGDRTWGLTFDPAADIAPVWSPNGKEIIFASDRDSTHGIYRKPATGAGSEKVVFKSPEPKVPTDWSRDGRFLLFNQFDPKTSDDIWWMPLTGDAQPSKYLKTEFSESGARFSPDGRFVAYESNASGRVEVYVRPFPDSNSGQWIVSRGNGVQPRWRLDGKELFYRDPNTNSIMAVDVTLNPTFNASVPKELFRFVGFFGGAANRFDVSGDGQMFIRNTLAGENDPKTPQAPMTVVLNWTALLRK